MIRRSLFIYIFSLLAFWANAQVGLPSIRTFKPSDYKGSTQIWAVGQDSHGLMYFGGNSGLYMFDGQDWHSFEFDSITPTVRCLQISGDTIWFGSIGDFGYITPDFGHGLRYHSLAQGLDSVLRYSFSSIWSVKKIGNIILYQGDTVIFRYDQSQRKLDTLLTGRFYFISKAGSDFVIPDLMKFYLYNPGDDSLRAYKMPVMSWLHFAYRVDDSTLLLVTSGYLVYYNIFTQKAEKILTFRKDIPQLAGKTVYSSVFDKQRNILIIGTVENGMYFLNANGKVVNHLNKSLGLRSNTVQYLYIDRDGNLWSGHSNGISLLRLSVPFLYIDERLGIEGQPYSVFHNKMDLLLGTNLGMYRLRAGRFIEVKDTAGLMTQQVFSIKEFKFSDGNKIIVYPSNSGIYYLDKDFVAHRISSFLGYNLVQTAQSPDYVYYISDYNLLRIKYKNGHFERPEKILTLTKHYMLSEPDKNYLWFISLYDKGVGYFNLQDSTYKIINIDTNISGSGYLDDGRYVFYSAKGLLEYDYNNARFYSSHSPLNKFLKGRDVIKAQRFRNGLYGAIVNNDKNSKFYLINEQDGHLAIDSTLFNILPGISDFYYFGHDLWFTTSDKFIRYSLNLFCNKTPHFQPLITKIILNDDSVVYQAPGDISKLNLRLRYKDNDVTIEYSLPSFYSDRGVEFSSWLEGRGKDRWVPWSDDTKREFTSLREGRYTFHLKARNEFLQHTDEITFSFRVLPPFYRTWWAYVFYLLVLLGIVYLIVRWRLNALLKEKEKLEQMVRERTAEIQQQKEEILAQAENLKIINEELKQKNEEIKVVLDQLEQANLRIQQEHKHVTDSITYAKKIQVALIQRQKKLNSYFPENFVLFQPKDVIGGDFYIFEQMPQALVLGVGDATGHGVPGALVSMLAFSFLTQIISRNPQTPAEVLEALRHEFISIFVGSEKKRPIYDGVDIALAFIEPQRRKLVFAGAHMPLVLIRDQEFMEIKASRNFIGYSKHKLPFENTEVDIQDGDRIYMFSDGFYDQFSSDNNSKFYRRNFYKLLLSTSHLSMEEQGLILRKTLEEWKGNEVQTDDVTVLGVKIDITMLRERLH